MKTQSEFAHFIEKRKKRAMEALSGKRLVLNHVCIRVPNMEKTAKLLIESFGINEFTELEIGPGTSFPGEKRLSGTWVADGLYLELMEPIETPNLDFDTGEGLPIGYLSEIGFFTPDLDAELERLEKMGWKVNGRCQTDSARMAKIDTDPPSGVPVELIEVLDFDILEI